jgi:hypothetical protein
MMATLVNVGPVKGDEARDWPKTVTAPEKTGGT